MAKWTMELRSLKNEFFEAMADYPIFNEAYRPILNNKIYSVLKFREIGYETPELFIDQLQAWLDLNMPYYNWLYKSLEVELTPTQRLKIIESKEIISEIDEKGEGSYQKAGSENGDSDSRVNTDASTRVDSENNTIEESTSRDSSNSQAEENGETNGKNNSYNSDFPQGNLNDLEDSNYFTTGSQGSSQDLSKSNSNSQTSSEGENNRSSRVDGLQTTDSQGLTTSETNTNKRNEESGSDRSTKETSKKETHNDEKMGNTNLTDFELIELYRKTFVNVDKKLINALSRELFINLW